MISLEAGRRSLVPELNYRSMPALARAGGVVLAGTGLLALCAHIALPLPFTPVPGTMQTFAVLLLGMALGPVLGPLTMVAYLLEGAAGLPVFAPVAAARVAFFGPTVGYLLSYPVAAFVAAYAYRRVSRAASRFLAAVVAGVLASLPIFAIGAGWLAMWLHLSFRSTMEFGVTPFLPGEGVKLILAALMVVALDRLRPTV